MKRSAQVTAPLLAATALSLLSACRRSPEMQRCVDQNNHVVDPSFCQNQPAAAAGQPGFGYPAYRFYYGGGGGYAFGSTATDGSYAPIPGHGYSVTSGTARGGFGSSFGGGEGGGGGE
jgi:hypothetical protein